MNNKHRFHNIDILRGLLMVIMAIDHCYLFFYQTHYAETWNSSIPNYGSIAIFFTRWISNIFAPGFALLMGMSMSFSLSKNSIGTTKNDKKFGVLFLNICFTVVYGVDYLFGSSFLQFKPNGKLNLNFSQSIVVLYVKDEKIYLKKYLPVSKIENLENINHG